jgi:signal transduction histidine kinase/CheY-like chemotaxis protein
MAKAETPAHAARQVAGKARRSLRERFESLSLADQFRASAIAAVLMTLLATLCVVVSWDTLLARHAALQLAERMAQSVSDRLEKSGATRTLDRLADQPLFLAADLRLASGEVLARYERGTPVETARPTDSPALRPVAPRRGLPYDALRLLALQPIYVEHPVQLNPSVAGTLGLVIDYRPLWGHALLRLQQSPLVLLLGCLVALVVANALRRQVVEPLAEMAKATRIRTQGTADPPPATTQPRNELTELATNFEVLAARVEEYERDQRNVRVAARQEVIDRTREIEARLEAAEAIARSKDEFLANMSHEIRTPMNGVLGMAELLAGTELDKRQRRYVDSMRTAAETMMQIINDILDDSKIEAGKMDLIREPFDVRDFAEQVGQLFAGRAESKKLELICRVEPTVPASVVGDVLRLRQVLGNLVSNAIKYTDRGEVQIRIGLDAEHEGRCRLHFSVSDTGPGIPESEHATVFQAFTQLTNAQRIGGTGLGLSIATRLVQLMGGERIDLRSEVGQGSSFSFVLPFEIAAAAPAPDSASDEFAGLRVLVVDDSPTSYMLLEEILSNWSADVAVLNHGRLLLDRLRDAATRGRPYAAVLLDHALPDATTEELLRAIRLEPAVAGTYVVLLSAFDFDPPNEDAHAIQPDVCIAKPVRQQLLKNALRTARAPREPAAGRAGAKTPSKAPEGAPLPTLGLDVLVVDDNEINREVALAMLERVGCRVVMAEDGSAAVSQARERRFDAILMDCQMPGMDGYAATEAIRREESARGMRPTTIVALTANVLSRDRNRCLAAGMNEFLSKPFTQEQLIAILRPIAELSGTYLAPALPPEPVEEEVLLEDASMSSPAPDVTATESEGDLSDTVVLDLLEVPLFDDEPSPSLPVLDAEQLAAIRGLGKPQVLERLCELLYASAPDTLARLAAALEAGDLEAAGAAAHSLKSPVSNLGGRRLAEQLERCEAGARDEGDLEATRSAARGLEQSYEEFAAALRAETRRSTGT